MNATAKQLRVTIRDTHGRDHAVTEAIPNARIRIDAVIPLLHAICDTVASIQIRGKPVSCAAGCAHCCYQLVPISPAEALFFNDLVRRLPRTRRRSVERDFKAIQNKTKVLANAYGESASSFDSRYFDSKLVCPFLEQNRCSIHGQRPLACREYHVDTPRRLCSNPYRTNPNRVAKGLNLGGLLAALCKHLFRSPEATVPLYAIDRWGNDHPIARITFDPEWLFSKLLHGVAKAAELDESIAAIEWELLNHTDYQKAGSEFPSKQLSPRAKATDNNGDNLEVRVTPIANAIVTPRDRIKLLVKHASAENVRKIVDRLLTADERLKTACRSVEIGAGDGYFRCLGHISTEQYVKDFVEKIIETENNEAIVADNLAEGHRSQLLDARDINKHFGEEFTPLVISFNVLDLFSSAVLEETLRAINATLMEQGRVIHVMSSSVHPAVFTDIAASNTDRILLPLYSEGTIGVILLDGRLIATDIVGQLAQHAVRPNLLATLFQRTPDEYIKAAAAAKSWADQNNLRYDSLLLHDYSMRKLSAAMLEAGFEIEYQGFVDSTVLATNEDTGREMGGCNVIANKLGVLTLDHDRAIPEGQIRQSSTFGLLVGRSL